MKKNQITQGKARWVMYVENKDSDIDGVSARIGWVEFSKTGLSIYYRGRTLKRATGGGISGNHYDDETGEEYWVSGIKKRGTNAHWANSVDIEIDEDAKEEYERIRNENSI